MRDLAGQRGAGTTADHASAWPGRLWGVLAHSRARDFAYRQAPLLAVLLVPLAIGLVLLAVNLVEGLL